MIEDVFVSLLWFGLGIVYVKIWEDTSLSKPAIFFTGALIISSVIIAGHICASLLGLGGD